MKIQRVFLLCILKIQHNEPDNYLRFHVARSISYSLSIKQSNFYSKNMTLKWIDIRLIRILLSTSFLIEELFTFQI